LKRDAETLAGDRAVSVDIDRLRFGAVTDFIDLPWWPAFNVADSCIVIGVLLLLWVVEGRQKRPQTSS